MVIARKRIIWVAVQPYDDGFVTVTCLALQEEQKSGISVELEITESIQKHQQGTKSTTDVYVFALEQDTERREEFPCFLSIIPLTHLWEEGYVSQTICVALAHLQRGYAAFQTLRYHVLLVYVIYF